MTTDPRANALDQKLAALYGANEPDRRFAGALRRRLLAGVGPLHSATVVAPYGEVHVAWRGDTVCSVGIGGDAARFAALVARRCGEQPVAAALPSRLAAALQDALAGRARYRGPVFLPGLSAFQCEVLGVVRRIPPGQVRPYQWVAREVGHPSAVRAVGTAVARNPVPLLVPCHRVVRADWELGSYSGAPAGMKARLLALEGVDIEALAALRARRQRLCGSATTRIFCLPTCVAQRRVRPEHAVGFASLQEARAAGFRPCRVCRPA